MRVLAISLFSHMPHHLATELELLQQHIDEKDNVAVLACMGFLPACMHKMNSEPVRCRECVTSRSNGIRLLGRAPEMFALDEYYTDHDRSREADLQTRFETTEEIQDYYFDGFDIGYAALSSTVFQCRDAYLESEEDKALLARMIKAAYRTFCSVREFLRRHPDFGRVYIFNGRFATCRGAFRACQQANVEVHLHERGSDNSKFMVYENSLPHNIQNMDVRIRAKWDNASEQEREQAKEFFEGRRERVEKFWHSHTKAQQAGRLPTSFDPNKRNIAVYTSSDDEYVAIGKEWIAPGFESQSQAIASLHKNLRAKDSDVHLYIRMHPHLKGVDNRDTRLIYSLAPEGSAEGVEVIPPDSNVCSYALMDRCEKVLTFGSTIGVEATYWGKTSILGGMNFYRALGAAWVAKGDDELLELIESPQLEPRPLEPALMYGLYMTSFGQPFKYYRSTDFETGVFRGTALRNSSGYSPLAWMLPSIMKTFGKQPSIRQRVEQAAWAVCHLPFTFLYDLTLPLRKSIRGRG